MSTFWKMGDGAEHDAGSPVPDEPALSPEDAEAILNELANTYLKDKDVVGSLGAVHHFFERLDQTPILDSQVPNVEAKYRALVEQLPAVVFMAYLDRGIGEAYVSPQIEATLGFSQAEWLEDPVLWYRQVHPDDKDRWSREASEMFLSGKPLRSAYRVIARDGQVIWFHCEARMIRHPDGRPWFIHGVAFDITDLKRTEEELQDERNVVSAILDTVGALVVVLDREGRIVRLNRACEQMTGKRLEEVQGQRVWDLFVAPEEREQFQTMFQQICDNQSRTEYESSWVACCGLYFAERALEELHSGRTRTWNEFRVPEESIGCGFHEAVRGVLSHHVVIRKGKIANYHPYPPTPWNANPRDVYGTPGPYEDAVQNTPIFEENGPDKFKGIDIMRAVRSFDPCLPCGVHMYLGDGRVLETRHSPMFGLQP